MTQSELNHHAHFLRARQHIIRLHFDGVPSTKTAWLWHGLPLVPILINPGFAGIHLAFVGNLE